MKGFIVYATYDILNDQTVVQLFGRLENGHSFAAVLPLEPYFFIEEQEAQKNGKLLTKATKEKTSLTTFQGIPVTKVSETNHLELNKLASILHKNDINTYEADVKPHIRLLIDHQLLGSIALEGDYETAERIDRVYLSPTLKPVEFTPKLKVISL